MLFNRSRFTAFGACALAATLATGALANEAAWPTKPVRIIVPAGPGGIIDIAARVVGQKMAENTGQSFIVENKAGADTRIGTEFVARAPGDGYTLLIAGGGFVVNPGLFSKLPYDTAKDFTPLAQVVSNPLLLVTGHNSPYQSVQDLLAAARAKPGSVTLASGGKGTLSHMSMELLADMSKADITHIPYRGGSAHTADVVSGQVSGIFENPSSAIPLVQGGRYRALATTGAERSPAVPDVPTVAESGVPGFAVNNWFGMYAPSSTPAPVVAQIITELERVLTSPEVIDRFAKDGVVTGGPTGEAFATFVAEETQRWGDITRARGISGD